ncbi:hypothetical protein Ahy_A09g046764 isoform E [Arachis hypogaea]|uniref:Uncharacterized protein n=1 Tax=Arachis hypogaea TaxID=3818 RepID=A0A445BQR8_ARAHY|nr:hypothetical protein Ahy_A09g046764 isoform E [Arachis hypogaea]
MVEDWRKRMWTQISDGVPVPHSLSCVEPFMVVGLEGDVIVTTGTWAGAGDNRTCVALYVPGLEQYGLVHKFSAAQGHR